MSLRGHNLCLPDLYCRDGMASEQQLGIIPGTGTPTITTGNISINGSDIIALFFWTYHIFGALIFSF